uniref:Uncharacterized protein n=1 Tax=Hyaloperonospora arabidopsidis (strain Emoy2) TaxID=559515 RepID=M4B5E4_HYAAE
MLAAGALSALRKSDGMQLSFTEGIGEQALELFIGKSHPRDEDVRRTQDR